MKRLVLLASLVLLANLAMSSHLRCGYITIQRLSCPGRTVIITVTVFTNTSSDVKFGEDGILDFGDGTSMVIPAVNNTPRPDLGPNIGMASYSINHTYSSSGSYVVSYVEPNRNGGVLNMDDSFFTTFYTETSFNLESPSLCSGPTFFVAPPIFSSFTHSEISFSLGATSNADTQVTYEMAVPFRDRGLPVMGYQHPENMSLNYLTGLLTWNTETAQAGEYNFAVNAVQWEEVNEVLTVVGYTRIDFQVILNGEPPETLRIHDNQEELDEYSRILVPAGETKTVRVFYEVDDSATPTLEMFSNMDGNAVSFNTYDSIAPPSGTKIKVGVITLTPGTDDLRESAYQVVVRGKQVGQSHVSDISYLIYTDALPPLPEIIMGTQGDIAQVQIFPNPVTERINIQVNRPGTSEALVYTMQGQVIKRKTFESQTDVYVQELPPGIYFCDIRRNNISIKKIKLIKN